MKFLVKNYSLEEQNAQKLGYLPFSHLPRECANHSATSCSGLDLSQSFLLQLYKQLNINWTRKTDWPSGEKKRLTWDMSGQVQLSALNLLK